MESAHPNKIPEHILREAENHVPSGSSDLEEIGLILDRASGFPYGNSDTEAAWNRLSARMEPEMKPVRKTFRYEMFRWVAAAVVVLTLGLGWWQYSSDKASTFTAFYNSAAKVSVQHLPDGSILQLNAGTELEVKAINRHRRVLALKKGEIFVSVRHNRIPFRVITEKGVLTVTGTEFNIDQRPGKAFAVYLKSGSIEFETPDKRILMKAGQFLQEDEQGKLQLSRLSNNSSMAWTNGKLSFENARVSEVIAGMERHYGVRFEYDTSLDSEQLSISFEQLDPAQAAALLSKTLSSKVSVLSE